MSIVDLSNAVTSIYDAVLDESCWATALKTLAEYVGAVDVGYLVTDKKTGQACTVAWWGLFSGATAEYMTHYGNIDPFRKVQETADCGNWIRATDVLSASVLSRDEWYNDFILQNGICDVLGAKLHESQSHVVHIGFQRPTDDHDHSFPRNPDGLRSLTGSLRQAARLHIALREIGHRAAIGEEVLKRLAAGVIFAEIDSKVVWANPVAEEILGRNDGLTVRNRRLCARRSFESTKLKALIAAAARVIEPSGASMLIARPSKGTYYIIRVVPVGAAIGFFSRPIAMVWIANVQDQRAAGLDVGTLFGFSRAQSRVALRLAQGKTTNEISKELGIKIPTVRSHFSAIFKKLNVHSKSDVVRILTNISSIGVITQHESAS